MPVPEDQLPVRLPENVQVTGKGGSPLQHLESWCRTPCPACDHPEARREVDTMDTFMDSSWYYWRYCAPTDPLDDPAAVRVACETLPVDVYIGGIEHAILHLLYARFIHKFLSERLPVQEAEQVSSRQHPSAPPEPFARLITQGLVEGLTHQCPRTGRYLRPEELGCDPHTGKTLIKATGEGPATGWTKMSKSKYNGVDPTDLVAGHGADVLRLCILFKAPPEATLRWNTRDIAGPQRWLVRLLNLAERISQMDWGEVARRGADDHLDQFRIFMSNSVRSVILVHHVVTLTSCP